eukprot:4690076-Lingulodinium_polyedra.AAC.1
MARHRLCPRGLPEPGGRAPVRRAGACRSHSVVLPAPGRAVEGWPPGPHAPFASRSMPRPAGRAAHPGCRAWLR